MATKDRMRNRAVLEMITRVKVPDAPSTKNRQMARKSVYLFEQSIHKQISISHPISSSFRRESIPDRDVMNALKIKRKPVKPFNSQIVHEISWMHRVINAIDS
jgi:hypothetical protein